MMFHSIRLKNGITVSDSECYKYIHKSDSGKRDFIVCSINMRGRKLSKKVTRREFDDLMCRTVEYK